MTAATNRIAPLLDPDPAPATPRARSPAQAEASRRNGALGRGPATDYGRARSARNSLKHGLFAKRVAPHRDDAGEQQDYERQLAGLVDEFRPAGRTEQNLVELLAGDYVKLGRVRTYTEAVMDPGPNRTVVVGADADAAERRLAVAEHLLARAADGRPFGLDAHDADWIEAELPWLARDIGECVKRCRRRGRGRDRCLVAGGTSATTHATLRSLGASGRRRLRAVLADEQPLTLAQRDQWHEVLVELVRLRETALAFARQQAHIQERAYRDQQVLVLGRLERLRLLQEYELRVRRDIERTTAMLVRLIERRATSAAGSGSFFQISPWGAAGTAGPSADRPGPYGSGGPCR